MLMRRALNCAARAHPLYKGMSEHRVTLKWERRDAEQSDEVAAAHYSITSSAVASSVGGTSRPSAFAVLRRAVQQTGCIRPSVISSRRASARLSIPPYITFAENRAPRSLPALLPGCCGVATGPAPRRSVSPAGKRRDGGRDQ